MRDGIVHDKQIISIDTIMQSRNPVGDQRASQESRSQQGSFPHLQACLPSIPGTCSCSHGSTTIQLIGLIPQMDVLYKGGSLLWTQISCAVGILLALPVFLLECLWPWRSDEDGGSCIFYEGVVRHLRKRPVENAFE
jgi:hypothetical protein